MIHVLLYVLQNVVALFACWLIVDGVLWSALGFARWLHMPMPEFIAMPPSFYRVTAREWVAPVEVAIGGLMFAMLMSDRDREVDPEEDDEDWSDRWDELLEAVEEFQSDPCRHNRHRLDRAVEEVRA